MWCITIVWFIGVSCAAKLTDPVVNITNGQVRGKFAEDGSYSKFLGIPYGQVNPKNPFGISTLHPGFGTVFNATNDTKIMCPQWTGGVDTLDCLRLNIYAPNNADGKLPVLVWIYGGEFKHGYAGMYDTEDFIVRQDVIFVSINYRLGPYGFMCLDTEEVPGNQGLRDQYLALQWVKENIASFGGDANRITAMGNSGGSIALDVLLLSELPKPFNRAILQSGTALTPGLVVPSDKTVPIRMANHLGFSTDNITEALSFLATVPSKSVIEASQALNISPKICVEKKFQNVERIISIQPEHNKNFSMLKNSNISILAGFASREGLIEIAFTNKHEIASRKPETFFKKQMSLMFDTDKMEQMVDKVRRFYAGDDELDLENDFNDFVSDFFFNVPVQRSLIRYTQAEISVYQYMFSYEGGRNYIRRLFNITKAGASHGDELGYLFNILPFSSEQTTAADQLTIDRITRMWTDFVKYGNPTPTSSDLIPVTWPKATKDEVLYLNIDTNLTVSTWPHRKQMLFWDLLMTTNEDKLLVNQNKTSSSSQHVSSIFFLSVIALLNIL